MEEETKEEGIAADDEASADVKAEEAEMMERLQEEIRNLPVGEHLTYMMHSLSSLAAGRMGLAPGSEAQRDLGQARLAIDAFKALMEIIERVQSEDEMVAHRGILSQLQLAYVAASEERPAAEPDTSPGDDTASQA